MTVLVTGSTGNLGRLVVQRLLARGLAPDTVVAGARTPEKASDLAALGVRVQRLDYDDAESVRDAVRGVDRVLLISGEAPGARVGQHRAVIDAAAAAGVDLLAYTSLTRADTSSLALAPDHVATERAIAEAGVPAAVLRNNWYTDNYAPDLQVAAATGMLLAAAGAGRIASAARLDYADAAAAVLVGDGHAGSVYELAGDTDWNYAELAEAMSTVLGREVAYVSQSAEERTAGLIANGVDEGTAGFIVGLEAGIRDGALDIDDHTLSRLIGRPTTSLTDALSTLDPA